MPALAFTQRLLLLALLPFTCLATAFAQKELSHKALFAPNLEFPYFEDCALPPATAPDTFDEKLARFLAEASLLAYVKETGFIETKLAQAGFAETRFFENKGSFAFLAISDDSLILCFRGTETADRIDYLTDANIAQAPFLDYGNVHQGFATALDWIAGDIDANIDELLTERPRKLWVTGHSLGGALATLYNIRRSDLLAGVYTYGTPRIGGVKFAKKAEQLLHLYRIVNDNDIIPRLPTPPFYKHIGSTYFITSAGELVKDPPPSEKWKSQRDGHAELIETLLKDHWLEGDFSAIPSDYIVDHSPRLYAEALGRIAEKNR